MKQTDCLTISSRAIAVDRARERESAFNRERVQKLKLPARLIARSQRTRIYSDSAQRRRNRIEFPSSEIVKFCTTSVSETSEIAEEARGLSIDECTLNRDRSRDANWIASLFVIARRTSPDISDPEKPRRG